MIYERFCEKNEEDRIQESQEGSSKTTVLRIQRRRLEGGHGVSCKPNSYEGQYTYSVVLAVYNAEKYLDAFFESLTSQTIDGKRIRLIMVDDGSNDGSAKVIAKWKQRFPELIDYYHKENVGQASALQYGVGLMLIRIGLLL